MVGTFTKFACSRPSFRSKHHHFLEDRVGGKRISPAASLHGVPPLENFEAVEHPSEPIDIDQTARCPSPEPSIMHDGLIWKERVAETLRRQNEKKISWIESDAIGRARHSLPRRRYHSSSNEKYLILTHSAPERIVTRMLE